MVFLFRPKNYKYIELFLETRDSKPLLDHSLLIIAGTRLEVNREPLKGRPQVESFPFLFHCNSVVHQNRGGNSQPWACLLEVPFTN